MAGHDAGAIGIASMALIAALLRGLVSAGTLTQQQADAIGLDAVRQVEANPDIATRSAVIQVFRDVGLINQA